MHFEYEIGPDEYVAAQHLYLKLSRDQRRPQWTAFCILGGLLLILMVLTRGTFGWGEVILVLMGTWLLYVGFLNLFPARYYRRAYRSANLAGKKFVVDVTAEGFEVAGESCSWRVRWPGVQLKGENEKVFMICSAGTIFMFGKKYLTDQQKQELCKLAGLASSGTPAESVVRVTD